MPLPACPLCKGLRYVLDRTGERSVARACGCNDSCESCGGTGRSFVEKDGYTFVKPCPCRSVMGRVALFNQARLPARCGLSFEDFDDCASEALSQAKRAAQGTAKLYRADAPSKGFCVAGPVGSGKTHLLCATVASLTLEAGVPCRYVEISFLFSEIRRGFSENRSGLDAIQPLVDADVLAIDELGKGRGSPFELDTLDELIARRYNAGRTTLFASNFSLAADRARARGAVDGYVTPGEHSERSADALLRDRVGDRIWSRLHEMCHLVQLPPTTADHRISERSA